MVRPPNDKPVASSFSMTGVLALLCGSGVLFFYWKFARPSAEFSGSARWILPLTGMILLLWGGRQIFGDLIPGLRSRQVEPDPEVEPTLRISWMGIVLMFLGMLMFYLLAKTDSGTVRLFLTILGALLFFWGIREVGRLMMTTTQVQRVERRVALPPSGLAYLVIMIVLFVGSQLGQSNMLMLVFSLMAGPFVINGAVIVIMLQKLTVDRVVPETAMAGELIAVELKLRNGKTVFSSSLMAVTDTLANDRERLQTGVLIARVPPKDERSARYQLTLMQRGRYRLGPVYVGSRFPLGIVERGLVFDLPGEILVSPRLGRLTPRWQREHGLADELVHRPNTRAGIFEDEFHRIREYRPGDNPRLIHWRSSARQNELMVREFHQSRNQSLIVLLDLWLPETPHGEAEDRVELAISFAATICHNQMRQSRDANLYVVSAGDRLTEWSG
ncbi:MAG: DUF58 domain-containing protein, partial [Planctomycetaceae bacterium]|nr:DUF58 domain-containing protein [Planctomycetaceae bacterium]